VKSEEGMLLDARDIEVVLDGTQILFGASLAVRAGEVHVLIGPNGAGKTTLANVVTGHVPMTAGAIELRGAALRGSVASRVHAGIGRKFQVPRVFARLDTRQHMMVAHRAPGARRAPAGAEGLEDGALDGAADVLSHGERQRLELAMVLVQGPAIAVLDEPTAGLTRRERSQLATVIRGLAGDHTFLIVEHDMDFVETVADTVSFMQDGTVLASGPFAEIARNQAVRAAYLGVSGQRARGAARAAADRGRAGRGALTARGLTVRRGHLAAVRGIDVELAAGGALGILGRNGAGKTTLLEGIMGLLPADGEVVLDGDPIHGRPAWWRARNGIALVAQGRQLFPNLTIAENLQLAASGERGDGQAFDVHELFPKLKQLTARKAGLLSGGEQQQVAIARALLRRPTLLLLDEPTEGLAPVIVEEISRVLEHLVASGLSIVLAEQHRSIVEELCDSFLMLRAGESAGAGRIGDESLEQFYGSL
jgi:branched-chain amino acid transport system ATP-binding protein